MDESDRGCQKCWTNHFTRSSFCADESVILAPITGETPSIQHTGHHQQNLHRQVPQLVTSNNCSDVKWCDIKILVFKLCENHLISLNSGVFAAQVKLGLESDRRVADKCEKWCSVWHNNLMSCTVIVNKANSDLLICNDNWQYAGLGLWT